MYIIIKTLAGVDYPDGKGGTISLNGNCYLNDISKAQLDYLKKNFDLDKQVEKGDVVISATAKNEKQVDETLQDSLDKQTKEIKKNESMNNVEIKQDKK